ncbi:MAG: lysine--tRNA ligase [Phycisphaerales bacterium]|nr:lysine--tRNA ligase [Phycisphaerales bacterium]
MTDQPQRTPTEETAYAEQLIADRRAKVKRLREELGVSGYGRRVDGLISLAEARAKYVEGAEGDARPVVRVAGRVMLHRDGGKLHWLNIRDLTADLQIAVSKKDADEQSFAVTQLTDLGDIIVIEGPVMKTRTGEITVWARSVEMACKSIALPPDKFHGIEDPEMRYRQRYVDMYVHPEVARTFETRSRLMKSIRRYMDSRGYLEVETPMLQAQAGGAAARPFITHLNAMDMDVYLRIAPELYLKRLLVGGMPRVYEINRNFRNEGVDRSHNPEFTMMEVYEAFGDYETMRELTEGLIHELAVEVTGVTDGRPVLEFDGMSIDCARPFDRVTYGELFERGLGVSMFDEAAVRAEARKRGIEGAASRDHWLLVSDLFDRFAEGGIDPARPTFVVDFPSAISPLTRPHEDRPELAYRWELFIAGMEFANSYTELNDPDVQERKFTEQLAGANTDDAVFRTLDHDFLNALRVGMPPAGGLGVGIDRLMMILTGNRSIRDVIPFPFMRPEGGAADAGEGAS